MVVAYRASLATGCPEAFDERRFGESMVRVAAAWLVWTLFRRLPSVDEELARQRVNVAIHHFVAAATDGGILPGLIAWAIATGEAVRSGPHTPSAATYPAFGGPPFV
jgi:hypothetical protein